MTRVLATTLVLLALCGVADARKKRDPVNVACREGERLARAKKYEEAAAHYGKAIAKVQKKGDVFAEQRLFDSLHKALERVRPVRGGRKGMGGRTVKAALLAFMAELDPKRGGAFVSAHALAAALLYDATREGDPCAGGPAEAVLAHVVARPKRGQHARAMHRYAQGLVALKQKKNDEASTALGEALAAMAAGQWLYDAMHVAVELAVLRRALGDDAGAVKALETVETLVPRKDPDLFLGDVWSDLVRRRLAKAPEAVLAPHERLRFWWHPGTPGGRGGQGRSHPTGKDESRLGAAWKRFSKRKALVTVVRDGYHFEVRYGFDKSFKEGVSPGHFMRPYRKDRLDGVILWIWGWGVGLAGLDRTGLAGTPTEPWEPTPFQAVYMLATGETWSINKKGEVSIQ